MRYPQILSSGFLIFALTFLGAQAGLPQVTVNPNSSPNSPNVSIRLDSVPPDTGDKLKSILKQEKEAPLLCTQIQKNGKPEAPFQGAVILFPLNSSTPPDSSTKDSPLSAPSNSLSLPPKSHLSKDSSHHSDKPKSNNSSLSLLPSSQSSSEESGPTIQIPGWSYDKSKQELTLKIKDPTVQTSADFFKSTPSGDVFFTCLFGITESPKDPEDFEFLGVQFSSKNTKWLTGS